MGGSVSIFGITVSSDAPPPRFLVPTLGKTCHLTLSIKDVRVPAYFREGRLVQNGGGAEYLFGRWNRGRSLIRTELPLGRHHRAAFNGGR